MTLVDLVESQLVQESAYRYNMVANALGTQQNLNRVLHQFVCSRVHLVVLVIKK